MVIIIANGEKEANGPSAPTEYFKLGNARK